MVNTGAPSRGCNTCKARKIKCDETKPTCLKCTNSGRICPGVPDNFEIIVRHETRKIEQRIQRASKARTQIVSKQSSAKRTARPQWNPSDNNIFDSLITNPGSSSRVMEAGVNHFLGETGPILSSLDLSNAEKAIARFFDMNMPVCKAQIGASGIFDFIGPMYQECSSTSVLHVVLHAVALMMNSRAPGYEYMQKEAFQKHSEALLRLRTALTDPVESKEDSTLLGTMLLSMYEFFRGSDDAVPNFSSHNLGAIALVRHRGTEQFRNVRSLRIFRGVRLQMIMSHIHRSGTIQPFCVENEDWNCDTMAMNESTNLSHIGIDACKIRSDCADLLALDDDLVTAQDVRQLVTRATDIDARLVQWKHNLTKVWHYWIVGMTSEYDDPDMPETSKFYPGPTHCYTNPHIAWIMNCYRMLRVYMNASAIRCITWLASSAPTTEQGTESKLEFGTVKVSLPLVQPQVTLIQQMVDDICASIPYTMCYMHEKPMKGLLFPEQLPEGMTPSRGAFFSLIPLFQAILVETVPELQRRWMRGRMRSLASINGVRAGNILAQAVPGIITGQKYAPGDFWRGLTTSPSPKDRSPESFLNADDDSDMAG